METTLVIVVSLLNLALVGGGIYLGAYLKKKAQNLATREEFNELEIQTAALTRTTARIEADINGELWDKQKRWELKREILFDAAKRLARLENALAHLNTTFTVGAKNKEIPGSSWKELINEGNEKWFKAKSEFDEAKLFVQVSCGEEMRNAFESYGKRGTEVAYKISQGDTEIWLKSVLELDKAILAVREAIRIELGIKKAS
jgi:hypothetical protein